MQKQEKIMAYSPEISKSMRKSSNLLVLTYRIVNFGKATLPTLECKAVHNGDVLNVWE